MSRKRKLPVFEKVSVTAAGAKGKGIAKAPDGRVIFAPFTVPGDVVSIQATKKTKKYYEGRATHFFKESEKRVPPRCEHFGLCGGCKWQNLKYEFQLQLKQQEVVENLRRLGGLELPAAEPILGAAETYFYRNKMEYAFSNAGWKTKEELEQEEVLDRRTLGLHIAGRWNKVLDLKNCYLQSPPANEIRLFVKNYALQNDLSFYDLHNQNGFLRNLMLRTASSGEVLLLLQLGHEDKEKREALFEAISARFPEIKALLYAINAKANDSVYDLDIKSVKDRDYIWEHLGDLQFKIRAKTFYQTNPVQIKHLYDLIKEYADLKGTENIYDLYSGIGSIALYLAASVKKVIGIESVADAVADAADNAQTNGITNATFLKGDMKTLFNDDFVTANGAPHLIITDPPRAGMHPAVIKQLIKIGAPKIIYVSCNSATQARDLALLSSKYKITRMRAVDMFPQTHHIENVVLLESKL